MEVKVQEALDKLAGPVGILGASKDGDHKVITVSWFTQVSRFPPMIVVSVSPNSSITPIVSGQREFVLSLLPQEMEEVARICGHTSENVDNKLETSKLSTKESKHVKVPSINEAIVNLECQTVQQHLAGDHSIIVAKILHVDKIDDKKPLIFYDRDLCTVDNSLSK
ncbi:flavin reductase [Alkalicella caledoniensis]|uniref:Flavin reductase n=1 Tax=Alkalicella caledoniensis TaxID=2731377 RepID=A0A7G9W9C1_ALKCA|nr:flavin reductase family protein [Alkalicella caledoniensis]QNO15283.1 flavin reductase [Alkalicella caledoniensis]